MKQDRRGAGVAARIHPGVQWVGTGFLVLMLAGFAMAAKAQEQEVIVSHGISTFGELKYPADFKHLDYVNPDAPKGGEMSQAWSQSGFDGMNPFSIQGRAALLSSAMYETILGGTSDEIMSSYCLLCTTMEYPKDRSWVIFNLREDVKFSDGTPMTSEDVIFSYNLFLTKGLSDFRTIFSQQVESAEALGPYKVKFTFKPGIPTRDLPASVGGLPVLSKAHYEAEGLDLEKSSLKPFLGTGAYTLDRMDVGKTIVYRRNPEYWGEKHPLNVGQNNFDTIRIEYFADGNAAFEGFKSGAYTFRIESSAKTWAEQYDFPALTAGHVKKVELPSGVKANGQGWVFNLRREKFRDPRVRQAIELMFNFEWSNRTLFYGLYERVDSIWENSYLEPSGPPSPKEAAVLQPLVDDGLVPASILTDDPVSPGPGGERQLDRKSLRQASALLDEAGWEVGDDGMRRNAKGETLSVEFLNDSPLFDRVINPYVENLRALGVDARMTRIDNAQMEARTRPPKLDFDIVNHFALSTYVPGDEVKIYFGSQTADDSARNIMGLKSPAVDRLAEVVLAAKTEDELITVTKALDRVLRAERFWVPQWYKPTYWVAYYDMYEHPETLPPYALGELSFWWYNAEKAEALKASGALN